MAFDACSNVALAPSASLLRGLLEFFCVFGQGSVSVPVLHITRGEDITHLLVLLGVVGKNVDFLLAEIVAAGHCDGLDGVVDCGGLVRS